MLVFGVFGCVGFAVQAWSAGAGGAIAIVASSLVLCCGPSEPGKSQGMYVAAAVLTAITAIISVVDIVLSSFTIHWVLQLKDSDGCQHATEPNARAICEAHGAAVFGWLAYFLIALVVVIAIALSIQVVCLYKFIKAAKSVHKQPAGASVTQGVAMTANKPVAAKFILNDEHMSAV